MTENTDSNMQKAIFEFISFENLILILLIFGVFAISFKYPYIIANKLNKKPPKIDIIAIKLEICLTKSIFLYTSNKEIKKGKMKKKKSLACLFYLLFYYLLYH